MQYQTCHQNIKSWTDQELTGVLTEIGEFQVVKKGRKMILREGSTGTDKRVPCDTYDYGRGEELIAYQKSEQEVPQREFKEGTFLEELINRDPPLREIFRKLPYATEDHQALAKLIENELVTGSDGGDNQDGRIVFTLTLASEDLTEIHSSSHEIKGGPKDSGQAEMMGIMMTIVYICHTIE